MTEDSHHEKGAAEVIVGAIKEEQLGPDKLFPPLQFPITTLFCDNPFRDTRYLNYPPSSHKSSPFSIALKTALASLWCHFLSVHTVDAGMFSTVTLRPPPHCALPLSLSKWD